MKKDIQELKVEDLAIAAVPNSETEGAFWDFYIMNLKEEPITNVLAVASAYGEINGEQRQSATMRYFFEDLQALDIQLIESVPVELLQLNNEYWVSFSFENNLWDKRYIFVPGSYNELNFTRIPFIDKMGILKR